MKNSRPDDPKPIGDALAESLARLGESVRAANARTKAAAPQKETPPATTTTSTPGASSMRTPPEGDEQPDFFVPTLYDVATKDSRSIMDVAVFRLSKKDKRVGDAIRYDLPDGYVEVAAGHYGMASVWDYDIVLMMISHFTETMNRHRDGRGPLPPREFRPYISEILKFCRRSDGGRQYQEVEAALDRLKTTSIKVIRKEKANNGRPLRVTKSEGLIADYEVVSYADNGHVLSVMIRAPEWLYKEIVEGKNPNVLTVHPDYFLIEPGIGRFIYRLARRTAGKRSSRWSFRLLYERSGSTGTLKKFTENLRKVITGNDLPEYDLREEPGKEGPQLVMTNREHQEDRSLIDGGKA